MGPEHHVTILILITKFVLPNELLVILCRNWVALSVLLSTLDRVLVNVWVEFLITRDSEIESLKEAREIGILISEKCASADCVIAVSCQWCSQAWGSST